MSDTEPALTSPFIENIPPDQASELLAFLAKQDRKARTNLSQLTDLNIKKAVLSQIDAEDRQRRQIVTELIKKGLLTTADDYHNAALIFQHGENSQDYRTAFKLSVQAVQLGQPPCVSLLAQTFDRYMLATQKEGGVPDTELTQRYGTQTIFLDNTEHSIPTDGKANPTDLRWLGNGKENKINIADIISQWKKLDPIERTKYIKHIDAEFDSLFQP